MAAFHRVHQQTVGYSDASYPTEIVRLHLSGTATMRKPRLNTIAAASGSDAARKGSRPAYFSGHGLIDTPVYDGDRLLAGARVAGPAIIEETLTTFVLPHDVTTRVDTSGNFVATFTEN